MVELVQHPSLNLNEQVVTWKVIGSNLSTYVKRKLVIRLKLFINKDYVERESTEIRTSQQNKNKMGKLLQKK